MTSPFEEDENLEGIELASTSITHLSQDEIDDRAHQRAVSEYGELQRIVLPEKATPVDAMKELSNRIPENEFGLPAFFYRIDLLPHDLGNFTQADADNCLVALDYEEGYPTYNGGHIFWHSLPGEPIDCYLLFQRYLDQAELLGLRQLQLLAEENREPMERVQALYHQYFWAYRARAHDLFQVAADRKRRELRSRRLEDRHYTMAQTLMEQLQEKMSDGNDLFKDLSGKEFLECLRLLINIQRVSNGLPQNGNAGGVPFNPDAAMGGRQLMEEITKGVQSGDTGLGLGNGLLELLKDPSFTAEAQSIVLRVRHSSDPNAQQRLKVIE